MRRTGDCWLLHSQQENHHSGRVRPELPSPAGRCVRKTRLEERGEPDEGAAVGANRAQFFLDVPSGPFYGFNRPGAKISQGLIENWWRQGMMGGAKTHYDCIKAFSETDFTEDLKAIDGLLAIKLVKHGTLKTYPGLPHGIASTHPDVINADLLEFARS